MAVTAAREAGTPLDVERIRADFPILSRRVHGKPLVYLDNAATSQKPRQVIDAMSSVYEEHNANIHRGVYEFSERTTALFEGAREKVAKFINAPQTREVIFCRNATEGLNLIMHSWGREHIGADDVIVTTVLEHHSNFVPWQQLAQQVGATLLVVDIDDEGRLRRDQYTAAMAKRPKLLAIPGVTVFGPKTLDDRVGVLSFDVAGIHPHDVAQIFDSEGICVRAGHHCNQPLMTRLGTPATTRASFYLYNTFAEIDALVGAIETAKRLFKV